MLIINIEILPEEKQPSTPIKLIIISIAKNFIRFYNKLFYQFGISDFFKSNPIKIVTMAKQ
jgi:hypothetical protein